MDELEDKAMWDVYAIDVKNGSVVRSKTVEKAVAIEVIKQWSDSESVVFLWPAGVCLPSWLPASSC